jgi:hypothetical protein
MPPMQKRLAQALWTLANQVCLLDELSGQFSAQMRLQWAISGEKCHFK